MSTRVEVWVPCEKLAGLFPFKGEVVGARYIPPEQSNNPFDLQGSVAFIVHVPDMEINIIPTHGVTSEDDRE